jgi:hypothetical protein
MQLFPAGFAKPSQIVQLGLRNRFIRLEMGFRLR